MLPMTLPFDLTPGCTPMNKTWEYHTGTLSYGDPLGEGVGSMTYPSLALLLPSSQLRSMARLHLSNICFLRPYVPIILCQVFPLLPASMVFHGIHSSIVNSPDFISIICALICFFPLLSFMCACTQLDIWLWAVIPINTSGKWIKETWCYTSENPIF